MFDQRRRTLWALWNNWFVIVVRTYTIKGGRRGSVVWNGELDYQRKVTKQPLLNAKACGQEGFTEKSGKLGIATCQSGITKGSRWLGLWKAAVCVCRWAWGCWSPGRRVKYKARKWGLPWTWWRFCIFLWPWGRLRAGTNPRATSASVSLCF